MVSVSIVVSLSGQLRRPQVDQQYLGALLDRQRDRSLIGDPDAVTLRQDDVVEGRRARHDMDPGGSAPRELVNEVMPRIDDARVNQRILVNEQRN